MNIEDILSCYEGNRSIFQDLKDMYKKQLVMPFIGAGLSAKYYPLWRKCLSSMSERYGIEDKTKELMNLGLFEEAASLVEDEYTSNSFKIELSRIYDPSKLNNITFSKPLSLLPRLWDNGVITTNFDYVLEKVYNQEDHSFYRTVVPKNENDVPSITGDIQQGKHVLYKIHGCITDTQNLVFTKKAYLERYGDPLNLTLPLTKALYQACIGKVLLFMGSSLDNDRTLKILESVSDNNLRHFAIMELPEETITAIYENGRTKKEKEALRTKRRQLAQKNIQCIWYPHGRHEAIEILLMEFLPLSQVNSSYLFGNIKKKIL